MTDKTDREKWVEHARTLPVAMVVDTYVSELQEIFDDIEDTRPVGMLVREIIEIYRVMK